MKKMGSQYVQIWIFLSVPYFLVVEKISMRQTFFFFFKLGNGMGPEVAWPNGAGLGPGKIFFFNNRARSGSQVLARRSGPGIKKPGPNSTRCHS